MRKVSKQELLAVMRELWGGTGCIDEEAKLVLAQHLINTAWNEGNRDGILITFAGTVIKEALGTAWLSSKERAEAGKPQLRQLLAEDPYYLVKTDDNNANPLVKLRISRLSKLIGNPELIAEYRAPGDGGPGAASGGGGGSGGGGSGGGAPGATYATADGLPIRPGVRPCPHYLKFGWCLFKQDCWYSHPPPGSVVLRTSGSGDGTSSSRAPARFMESRDESGVVLLDGTYPQRPGKENCLFFLENGWCRHKAICRYHHPPRGELSWQQQGPPTGRTDFPQQRAESPHPAGAAGASSLSSSSAAPGPAAAPAPAAGRPGGGVKQPPLQVLLGVVIDSVWPPRQSKEDAVKAALAKHMVDSQIADVMVVLRDPDAVVRMSGSAAGTYLSSYWTTQQRLWPHDPKPWKSRGLAALLEGDPLFAQSREKSVTSTINLNLGQLITRGASSAAELLSSIADIVWPPLASQESYLRGTLAKWLLHAGFGGGGGEVLRQLLSVRATLPTVFRIDIAQAAEYLVRCWARSDHPYAAPGRAPYRTFKGLIQGDQFLAIEPAPGKPHSSHATLDVMAMLRELPRLVRANRNNSTPAAAAGAAATARPASAGAGASAAAAAAGPSSRAAAAPPQAAPPLETAPRAQQAAAAPPAYSAPPPAAAAPVPAAAAGAPDPAGAARATIAALEALQYEPPPPGNAPRRLSRWVRQGPNGPQEPPASSYAWAEVAVRLLSADDPDATMRVAEMVQHLEICPILAVACSIYAKRPHLLQFFAPHAAVGGLEMPAAVYLLDLAGRAGASSGAASAYAANTMALVGPVLASADNIKVTHSSRQWSGYLDRIFGVRLAHYIDTQQANYVWKVLLRQTGRGDGIPDAGRAADASYSALIEAMGLWHPVRHVPAAQQAPILWQARPLSSMLVTCAAADVIYMITLLEDMVRKVRQAAVAAQKNLGAGGGARAGTRAAALLTAWLPPELAEGDVLSLLAEGVEDVRQRGGISMLRLGKWAGLRAFHQAAVMHH